MAIDTAPMITPGFIAVCVLLGCVEAYNTIQQPFIQALLLCHEREIDIQ